MDKKKIVILGAGAGGLAAGWFLSRTGRYEVTVVERASFIGGLCSSFKHDGFILDHGPHKMYSAVPGILDELRNLMGDQLLTHRKRNSIRLNGHLLDYPLKMTNLAKVLGPNRFVRLGADYGLSLVQNLAATLAKKEATSYADYVTRRFGRGVYELVFEPLAWKVWGDPRQVHAEMARTRIPSGGAGELILKLLKIKRESTDTDAEYFYYPRKGFGQFPEAMAAEIEKFGGKIILKASVTHLAREGSRITAAHLDLGGEKVTLPCRYLVSSIPLPDLGKLIFQESKPELTRVAASLKFRHLMLVYLFIRKPQVCNDHWIFFPEKSFIFNRLSEQKVMSPEMGPPDRTSLCCDLTCSEEDAAWRMRDDEMAAKCAETLAQSGFIHSSDVEGRLVKRSRNFYPVYDLAYAEKLKTVSDILRGVDNLLTTGRIGMYNYNNSDHCADMGKFIAEKLTGGTDPGQIWEQLEKRVSTYKIVD